MGRGGGGGEATSHRQVRVHHLSFHFISQINGGGGRRGGCAAEETETTGNSGDAIWINPGMYLAAGGFIYQSGVPLRRALRSPAVSYGSEKAEPSFNDGPFYGV